MRQELTVSAELQNLERVTEFINSHLISMGCSRKTMNQIDIAVDELFGNIVRYAYVPESGWATVQIHREGESPYVQITFRDRGAPYNPLDRPDPDVSLSAEEREPGGLGIYLVKNSMDEVRYTYEDGQNILTVKKRIGAVDTSRD